MYKMVFQDIKIFRFCLSVLWFIVNLIFDSFFKDFESIEWEGGQVDVRVLVSKKTDVVSLELDLEGSIDVICDRCLSIYPQEVSFSETIFLKFGDEEAERAADIEAHRVSLDIEARTLFDVGDNPLGQALARLGKAINLRESVRQTESLSSSINNRKE